MISGISGVSAQSMAVYAARGISVHTVPAAKTGAAVAPVSPVTSVRGTLPAADDTPLDKTELMLRWETDPAAYRIRNSIIPESSGTSSLTGTAQGEEADGEVSLSGERTESARETAQEAECETCKRRKYQDGSDDPGVSFKTPSHIDPDMASSVVRGHEMEHVVREQASAQREGRRVVSQSVTYHTGICPECGRVYVSGGTTRTTTADIPEAADNQENADDSLRFFAVA